MIPLELSGVITVVALVALGIFVYPWMLGKRWGKVAIAFITLTLAALYLYFDRGRASLVVSAGLGALWALAPVIAAWLARRMRGSS